MPINKSLIDNNTNEINNQKNQYILLASDALGYKPDMIMSVYFSDANIAHIQPVNAKIARSQPSKVKTGHSQPRNANVAHSQHLIAKKVITNPETQSQRVNGQKETKRRHRRFGFMLVLT